MPGASSARHCLSADISNCFPGRAALFCVRARGSKCPRVEWGARVTEAGNWNQRGSKRQQPVSDHESHILHVLGAEPGLTVCVSARARWRTPSQPGQRAARGWGQVTRPGKSQRQHRGAGIRANHRLCLGTDVVPVSYPQRLESVKIR